MPVSHPSLGVSSFYLSKVAWVIGLLAVSTAMRWAMDPFLGDELPFFLYLPAILLAAAFCGFGAGLTMVIASLVVTSLVWVPPTGSWFRMNVAAGASLAIWFLVSTCLVYAIALLQKTARAQGRLLEQVRQKSSELVDKSARLELSEKALAVHAENLERLVAERTVKLEDAIVELESFSYSASHDLRSPLRTMQGFSHLLIEEHGAKLDAVARDYLHRIDRAAQRLDTLLADVLSYSSVSRRPLEPKHVDLEQIIDSIIAEYSDVGRARDQIHIDRPLLPVHATESLVTQAVSNLLRNAVKFVAPGALPDERVWTESHGQMVRLHVSDQGIGISPAALPHIFRPFHRAADASAYEGTGVGLAIVKRAIEQQGGRVGVVSEPGRGTDFWIELPTVPTRPTA